MWLSGCERHFVCRHSVTDCLHSLSGFVMYDEDMTDLMMGNVLMTREKQQWVVHAGKGGKGKGLRLLHSVFL